jgi:O-antigen/teichoic acid export membrane protein
VTRDVRIPSQQDTNPSHGARRDSALRRAGGVGALTKPITIAVGFLTVSVAVHALDSVRAGVALTLTTLTALFGFADLGIGQGLLTKLAIAHGRDDVDEMRGLVSSAWATLLVIGAVVAVMGTVLTLALPWSALLGAERVATQEIQLAVLVVFLATAAAIPFSIGQRILTGLQRGAEVSTWFVASAVAALAGVSLASVADAPLWAFVLATVGGPVAVAIVQTIAVLGGTHAHLRPRFKLVSRVRVRELISVSGLFLALNIAVAVAYQTDTLVVSAVLGASAAVVFGITLRMFTSVASLFSGLTQQMWPALAEALARGDATWARRRFLGVLRFTTTTTAGLALVLVLLGQPLARVWVGSEHVPPISLLIPFAVWTVYALAMTQCSYLLNAAEVVGPQIAMATAMAAVNVPLSVVLARHVGMPGPIYGSLVSHAVFVGIPTVLLVRRVLNGHSGGVVA